MIYQKNDGYFPVRFNDLLAPIMKSAQELKTQNESLMIVNGRLQSDMKEMSAGIRRMESLNQN